LVIDEQDQLRPHMRFFVNGEQVLALAQPLAATDTVHLVQALSGG
jgi:sulfur-carrier protein